MCNIQVIGAAMFHVRVGNQSVLYTGDYNMTPDRHLGSAWIDAVKPDLLITESTFVVFIFFCFFVFFCLFVCFIFFLLSLFVSFVDLSNL